MSGGGHAAPAKGGGGGSHGGGGGGSGGGKAGLVVLLGAAIGAIATCGQVRLNGRDKSVNLIELSRTEWVDAGSVTAPEGYQPIVVSEIASGLEVDCQIMLADDTGPYLTTDPDLPPYDGKYGVWRSVKLRGLPGLAQKQFATIVVLKMSQKKN